MALTNWPTLTAQVASECPQALTDIIDHREKCKASGRLLEAEYAQGLLTALKKEEDARRLQELADAHAQQLAALEGDRLAKFEACFMQWKARLEDLSARAAEQWGSLVKRHEQEMQNNRRAAEATEPRLFWSRVLHDVRRCQDVLVQQNKFARADKIRAWGDAMESDEADVQALQWQQRFKLEEAKLAERQTREVEGLRTKHTRMENDLLVAQDRDLEKMMKHIQTSKLALQRTHAQEVVGLTLALKGWLNTSKTGSYACASSPASPSRTSSTTHDWHSELFATHRSGTSGGRTPVVRSPRHTSPLLRSPTDSTTPSIRKSSTMGSTAAGGATSSSPTRLSVPQAVTLPTIGGAAGICNSTSPVSSPLRQEPQRSRSQPRNQSRTSPPPPASANPLPVVLLSSGSTAASSCSTAAASAPLPSIAARGGLLPVPDGLLSGSTAPTSPTAVRRPSAMTTGSSPTSSVPNASKGQAPSPTQVSTRSGSQSIVTATGTGGRGDEANGPSSIVASLVANVPPSPVASLATDVPPSPIASPIASPAAVQVGRIQESFAKVGLNGTKASPVSKVTAKAGATANTGSSSSSKPVTMSQASGGGVRTFQTNVAGSASVLRRDVAVKQAAASTQVYGWSESPRQADGVGAV